MLKKLLNDYGVLAQLARAPALHAGGQGFDSLRLHHILKVVKVINNSKKSANRLNQIQFCGSKGDFLHSQCFIIFD